VAKFKEDLGLYVLWMTSGRNELDIEGEGSNAKTMHLIICLRANKVSTSIVFLSWVKYPSGLVVSNHLTGLIARLDSRQDWRTGLMDLICSHRCHMNSSQSDTYAYFMLTGGYIRNINSLAFLLLYNYGFLQALNCIFGFGEIEYRT